MFLFHLLQNFTVSILKLLTAVLILTHSHTPVWLEGSKAQVHLVMAFMTQISSNIHTHLNTHVQSRRSVCESSKQGDTGEMFVVCTSVFVCIDTEHTHALGKNWSVRF